MPQVSTNRLHDNAPRYNVNSKDDKGWYTLTALTDRGTYIHTVKTNGVLLNVFVIDGVGQRHWVMQSRLNRALMLQRIKVLIAQYEAKAATK